MEKTSLIIVESPAKARTLSKILGKDFNVKSSVGHVRDLPQKKFGVEIEENFKPTYVLLAGKQKVIKEIKSALKNSDTVYLATDPDREGEAIAWHIVEALNIKGGKRISFHEITKPAILDALKHPHSINEDLVNAQQARRILDRIVGYKLSPVLWKKVKGGSKNLSAGRVQSVALRMVVDRESEIENFVKEEYWTIHAFLLKKGSIESDSFEAKLHSVSGKKVELKTAGDAEKIVRLLKDEPFTVTDIKVREQRRNPAPPFITSTLQQEANKRFGYTANRTMGIAQSLYEGIETGEEGAAGLITYMRTDSVTVSSIAQNEARDFIAKTYGKDYLPDRPPFYKSRKTAQEAHEAIRPTSVFRTPDRVRAYLNDDQFKVYQLIFNRFLASQMKNALFNVSSVEITAGDALFKASGSTLLFDGFLKLYNIGDKQPAENNQSENSKNENAQNGEKEEAETDEERKLPALSKGEPLGLNELKPVQHFTQPPPRYTEASLVKALEEKGIGRPSTYAPTLEVLKKRNYVQREGRFLSPTSIGKTVTGLLIQHFKSIMDIEFTAQLEDKLDSIEEGKQDWVDILRNFWGPFEVDLTKAIENAERVTVQAEETDVDCEKCGKKMVIKWGRFGKFMACSGFPDCKNTRAMNRTGIPCPQEGCGGEIVERRGRGRKFYGCTRYPDCKFTSIKKPDSPPAPAAPQEPAEAQKAS